MIVRRVELPSHADFAAWRTQARALMQDNVPPDEIFWTVAGEAGSDDLFAVAPGGCESIAECSGAKPSGATFNVPAAFISLAHAVICHSAPARFSLLYRVLWRLRADRHLMEISADADVRQAETLAKDVRRDKHKMTAFVRFREVISGEGSRWVAWFEPQHHIVEATAPFFVRRFASMRWSILTPRVSAHWDGEALTFTHGARRQDAPADDAAEEFWRVYFASIFNPARLNTSAMQREMPKKYWKNMPETALIPELVRSAQQRTQDMLAKAPTLPRVTRADRAGDMTRTRPGAPEPGQRPENLPALRQQLDGCRRCPLWRDATQPVAGVGPSAADIMLVGEQPGDQEDLTGQPFVGPAGRLLDAALEQAGLPRAALYITNAVKHFKFEPRGKLRLHKKANASEIDICRWWLADEIRLVKPKLIVALGATAAGSLLQRPVKIGAERGQPMEAGDGAQVLITVHPSYLLRLPDARVAETERQRFVADLTTARTVAERLGAKLAA